MLLVESLDLLTGLDDGGSDKVMSFDAFRGGASHGSGSDRRGGGRSSGGSVRGDNRRGRGSTNRFTLGIDRRRITMRRSNRNHRRMTRGLCQLGADLRIELIDVAQETRRDATLVVEFDRALDDGVGEDVAVGEVYQGKGMGLACDVGEKQRVWVFIERDEKANRAAMQVSCSKIESPRRGQGVRAALPRAW